MSLRAGNGKIDDGLELFGPSTGNGFAEFARYDSDGNRFIDEGDESYEREDNRTGFVQQINLTPQSSNEDWKPNYPRSNVDVSA